MSIDRRNFFKTLGVAGLTLAAGRSFASDPGSGEETEFMGILYDSTQCLGCRVCEETCANIHNLPVPEDEMVAGVTRKTNEKCRTVINMCTTSKGEIPVKNQCMLRQDYRGKDSGMCRSMRYRPEIRNKERADR